MPVRFRACSSRTARRLRIVGHAPADELIRNCVFGLRWCLLQTSKEFRDELLLLRCHFVRSFSVLRSSTMYAMEARRPPPQRTGAKSESSFPGRREASTRLCLPRPARSSHHEARSRQAGGSRARPACRLPIGGSAEDSRPAAASRAPDRSQPSPRTAPTRIRCRGNQPNSAREAVG
jgi:hypothetical protein